ncbi:RNA recognition motif-containing protein [Gnomoniopsis smithogilvyi]|uniref:RNA recognition motif-containing protein n=1 Tax=Gnomoniopsis smithogilvyi TaxID=1191159 RepID=A0A9W8YTW3_9PEZI|nr:RNA recognition motif-containing protein [Gnomoniopsis smithogilvyi]
MAKTQGQKRRREAEADLEQKTAAAIGAKDGAPPSKKSRVEERRSLFVRSLPASATSESLTEYFSQHYPVKHATVVVDKNTKASRGYGFVTFTDADDAIEAKKKLNNEMFDGRRLRLDVAEPRQRAGAGGPVKNGLAEEKKRREEEMAEARKAPKLIIRNLPWSIKKEDHLSKLFMKYGKIKFTDLPQDKGLLKGFGFITFKSRKHAERALEEMNGKELDGRTIAVDWAVSKDEWKQQQDADEENEEKKPKAKKAKKEEADKTEDKEMTEADRDLANFMKTMEDLDSEEDDNDEEDDDEEDDEEGGGQLDSDKEDGDSKDEQDLADDSEELVEEKPKRTTDNSTTVFIRNLPFTSTDESLKEHFTKFGPVRYARVVMNKAIDKPAGTGFVCFFNADDFKACVRSAPRHQPSVKNAKSAKHSVLQDETIDSDGRYTIDGRVLQVTQAVSKEEATKLTEAGPGARKGQDKDKRRLYLLSEGTIPKNSPLYNLLTPTEVKLREQSNQQRKKQVMSNPSLHLSLTRLAIRNLPRNIDSKELKQLARQAIVGFATDVREGKRQELSKEEQTRGGDEDRDAEAKRKDKGVGVVKQAKIVYETKDGKKVKEETGAGKSRGYGFIEYWSHRWALMGLRWLNGHPLKNEAGKTVRLIVEFAIENQQVVTRRKANEARSRQIQAEILAGTRKPGEKDEKEVKGKKGQKANKKGKKDEADGAELEVVEDVEDEATKSKKRDATEKLAQRQRIIGRKRMARKTKKVTGRKGK